MIKMIGQYKRWKDYLNFKEAEVKISFLCVIVFLSISMLLDMRGNFAIYQEDIKTLIYSLIGGFIGIAGLALSGIAILTSMFSEKQIETIEKNNGKGIIERIMSSFAFLAFNVVLTVIYMILLVLFIISNYRVPGAVAFYAIEALTVYAICFNLFYTVSLVFNCIQCFGIKRIYDVNSEKDFFDKANELRIDYILSFVLKQNNITREEFLKTLDKYSVQSEYEKELIEYFKKYYGE